MTDRAGIHRRGEKVHAVDERVGRDDRKVRARRLPRGSVIPDAERNPARTGSARLGRLANLAKCGDERIFGQRRLLSLSKG
jgi:hypothetical protein